MQASNTKHSGLVWVIVAAAALTALLVAHVSAAGGVARARAGAGVADRRVERPAAAPPQVSDIWALVPMTTTTPSPTFTPGGTVTPEPEMAVLQYMQSTHQSWYCQGPYGTPGHRYVTNCYTFQYGTHPARGYVDNYGSESAAQAEWLHRRDSALGYPIFHDLSYGGYPGYEAGDENWPYGHLENYFWGSIWVMGGTSQDDTQYNRGAGSVANAIYQAALALGYLGSPTPTPSVSITPVVRTPIPTFTGTPTVTPTYTPTATATISCLGAVPMCTTTPTNTATPCSMYFVDVRPTDYFYEPVLYLYCRGIVSGYGDGTFRPYNNATRGQLTKIVALAAGWTIYTPPTPTFRDVPASYVF